MSCPVKQIIGAVIGIPLGCGIIIARHLWNMRKTKKAWIVEVRSWK